VAEPTLAAQGHDRAPAVDRDYGSAVSFSTPGRWPPELQTFPATAELPYAGLGVTVGIGLVGCGQWGLNYLRAFSDLEGCQVVAACDVSPQRLHEAERRSRDLRTTSDLSEVIGDPQIQAVVIATPATQHYATVVAALEAGKDCLVEKPMTADVGQARRLRELAKRSGRLLMVGHVFRFNPAINFIQRLVAAGGLGELEYLYFTRTNLGPIRSDVNVVWDLMTHDVSILLHFLNQAPTSITGQAAAYLRPEWHDVAFATLAFPHGILANIRASWLDPRKVREITLVGTSKMAVFNDLDPTEPVRIYDKGAMREPTYESFGEFKLVTRSGDVVSPQIPTGEPLRNQCQHFLRAIEGRERVLSDVDDGLRVVEIIDAINRSIAQNGVPQSLAVATVPA
jgi:predicted dehydrogenase